jgi:hypothetical protein
MLSIRIIFADFRHSRRCSAPTARGAHRLLILRPDPLGKAVILGRAGAYASVYPIPDPLISSKRLGRILAAHHGSGVFRMFWRYFFVVVQYQWFNEMFWRSVLTVKASMRDTCACALCARDVQNIEQAHHSRSIIYT